MLFGYPIEPDFDAAREHRQDVVGRVLLVVGTCGIAYALFGLPYGVQVFQACIATVLFYGTNFYVRPSLETLGLPTTPALPIGTACHIAYLGLFFWLDKISHDMTKAAVFIPRLCVGYVL